MAARKFFEYRKRVRDGEDGYTPVGAPEAQVGAEHREKAAPRPVEPVKRPVEAPRLAKVPVAPPASREDEEMDIEDVKEFIRLVTQSEVDELHVETAGMKVKIKKGTGNSFPLRTRTGQTPAAERERGQEQRSTW